MKRTALVVLGCLILMPGTVRAQNGFPEVTLRPGQRPLPMAPIAVPASGAEAAANSDRSLRQAARPGPVRSCRCRPESRCPCRRTLREPDAAGPVAGIDQRARNLRPHSAPSIRRISTAATSAPKRSLFRDYDAVFGGHRLWAESDYLLWWFRKAPIGVPLVTTGPFTDPAAGHLNDPQSSVVLGPGGFDSTATGGGRIRAGIWIEPWIGVEFAGMLFDPPHSSQTVSSVGSPILSRPVIIAGAEHSYDIAYPGRWSGSSLPPMPT